MCGRAKLETTIGEGLDVVALRVRGKSRQTRCRAGVKAEWEGR